MTSEAEIRHENAVRTTARATKALDDANVAVAAAEHALDMDPKKVDAVLRAQAIRDSAIRVLAKRQAEEIEAGVEMENEKRAVMATELVALRAKLSAWRQEIAPTIAKVCVLDATIADELLDLGVRAGDAEEIYLRALDLAHALNEETRNLEKPSLLEARLELGKALTIDRGQKARFDQSSWLASVSMGWEVANLSAEARAANEAEGERVRRLDEIAKVRNAGIQIGAQAAMAALQHQQKGN